MVSMTPRQKSAMRNGKAVRLKGGNMSLYIDTDNYDKFSKSFLSGKGVQHTLSPAEVAHNEGMGVFKKAKKAIVNTAKKIGRQTIKAAMPYGDELGATLGAAAATMSGNPQFAPMGAVIGQQLGDKVSNYLGDEARSLLKTHKQRVNQPRSRGPAMDPLRAANLGQAANQMALAGIDQMRSRLRDNQAPAPMFSSGYGLKEVGSVRGRSSLITDPAATTSQPYSANFQFRHTLPPAYAAISKNAGGKGLYAGGNGLYAQPAHARG